MGLACACAVRGPRSPAAVFPSGAEFHLELAADSEARRIGYMFRTYVGPRDGMLFVFDGPDRHPFWMKNCKVNLDIIWIDSTRRVVEIAHDLAPCAEDGPCPSVFPMRAATYVLEVAGGTAAREGLDRGDLVTLVLDQPGRP